MTIVKPCIQYFATNTLWATAKFNQLFFCLCFLFLYLSSMLSFNLAISKLQARIMSFYAVAIGREVGIYNNWTKCEEQIKGFKGARYKKFPTRFAAEAFIKEHNKDSQFVGNLQNEVESTKAKPLPTEPKPDSKEFWPPSDGDTYDENQLTDNDLLMALAEVEGLPEALPNQKRKITDKSTDSCKRMKHDSVIWEPAGLKHIAGHEFEIDCEGYVIVYTDGSCFNNGRKNACAGYGVYFGDNHPLNISRPVEGRVTNNVGEIQASIYAVKTAMSMGIKKLCISTDSQFLINSVTLWMKGWKCKNWRLKNGEQVKNIADFKELDALLSTKNIEIKWNYVAAHKGIKGNEMADQLAREGSETYKRLHLKT